MAIVDRVLEEKLMEAGEGLLQPPSSAQQLLPLLDQVEKFLQKVDQSPSKSMLDALSPIMKALVADELLRNPNEDVKVAVASCISEITRITAPEAPYEDEQMKEVFQLIVSSFENLSDTSSDSYSKRTLILETVAKVRSCVVMLDLECDSLIVEMFQHFLRAVRDHHPENVFSSMETVMTLVLEESEEIALELISPILASLKKDNEVQPIARKLAEKVFVNCGAKIKTSLIQAKSSGSFSFDDYNKIISEICEGPCDVVEHDNHESPGEQLERMANAASSKGADQGDENKLVISSSDEAAQGPVIKEFITKTLNVQGHPAPIKCSPGEDHSALVETGSIEDHPAPVETGPEDDHPAPMETDPRNDHPAPVKSGRREDRPVAEESAPREDHPAPNTSSKSVTSNGVADTENEDVSADPLSSKTLEYSNDEDRSHDANVVGVTESGYSDSGKMSRADTKSAQVSKKRSRKPNHSMKSTIPSESSDIETDKEAKQMSFGDRIQDKEVHASPSSDSPIDLAIHVKDDGETAQILPSPSENVHEEGRSIKVGRSKKKNKSIQEALPSEVAGSQKASEGTNDMEVKQQGRLGKKAVAGDIPVGKTHATVKASNVEGGSENDSDAKVVVKSGKKRDTRDHAGIGSSSKKEHGKQGVRGKGTLEKEAISSSMSSKVIKDENPLEEAPKTSSKRKHTPSKEKATDVKNYGQDLVGAKVKVWWPMDKMYYEGVVDSFDRTNKKHKVLYADGDLEVLNLRDEKWKIVRSDGSMEDGEEETRGGSSDSHPEMQRKKKAKTGTEQLAKKGKTAGSRDGEASSSKSRVAAIKSARKSVDNLRVDDKGKGETPKPGAKSEDVKGKSKVRPKKSGGKSAFDTSEKAEKFKDEDDKPKPNIKFKLGSPKSATKDTPKAVAKETSKAASKETPKLKTGTKDTPKNAAKDKKSGLKCKTSKSASKSSLDSAGKLLKSSSVKIKESEDSEESLEVVKKASQSGKGNSPGTFKRKETDGKSGKKRRRG